MKPVIDGKYEVLGELARGGMGVVYRARDLGTEREVALKLIQGGALNDRQRERFAREGIMAAGLDHSGIVRVHASGEHDGQPYLVQELVPEARTLEEVFRERPLVERVRMVGEAARAVGYAHEHGVIHRDLKPANLLVGSDGRVRVADFGLAYRADLDHLTRTGELLGTPTHMAPEQFKRQVGAETPATDVWALGVTLYQALTHELPFQGSTVMELAGQIEAAAPSSPRARSSDVSPGLETVCLKALRRNPEDRYPNAAAFADALEQDAPRRSPMMVLGLLTLIGVVAAAAAFAPRGSEPTGTATSPSTPTAAPTAPSATPAPSAPNTSGVRRLVRLRDPAGRTFGRALFIDPARFVVRIQNTLREYRIEWNRSEPSLRLARSTELAEPLHVFNEEPQSDAFDLIQDVDRPWLFSDRRAAELFAGRRFRPELDIKRDVALVFQPRWYSRSRGARHLWALLERRDDGRRRVHVVTRAGGGKQVVPKAVIEAGGMPIGKIRLSPRGRRLALLADTQIKEVRALELHRIPKGRVWRTAIPSGAHVLQFSPDGEQLIAGTQDGLLLVFRPVTNRQALRVEVDRGPNALARAHQGAIRAGTFSRDGRTLVTTSRNQRADGPVSSVRFWDTQAWKPLPGGALLLPDLPVETVSGSPDDRYLVFSGAGALELWSFGIARR